MKIKNNNLYTIDKKTIKPGQKAIRFSKDVWLPIGFNQISYDTELDCTLGYVDSSGKFQPVQFNNKIAENSSDSPEEVENYKIWVNPISSVDQQKIEVHTTEEMNFYKCASVDTVNHTWTGYNAVLSGGVYSFESTVTSGLTYGNGFTPVIGETYNDGAMIVVSNLWVGIPSQGLIRYAILAEQSQTDELGNTMTTYGTPTFAVDSGVACVAMDSGSYIGYGDPISGLTAYTLSIWMKHTTGQNAIMTFSGGSYGYGGNELWLYYTSDGIVQLLNGGESNYMILSTQSTFTGWRHLSVVWTGTVFRLYVDGVQQGGDTSTGYNINSYLYPYINTLKRATGIRGDGKYAAFRLYNRVLTTDEIAELAAEITPSA